MPPFREYMDEVQYMYEVQVLFMHVHLYFTEETAGCTERIL